MSGGGLSGAMYLCQEQRLRPQATRAAPETWPEKSARAHAAAASPRRPSRWPLGLSLVLMLYVWCRWLRADAPHNDSDTTALLRAFGPSIADEARCRVRASTNATGCVSTWRDRARAAEAAFLDVPSAESARAALQRYTSHVHIASDDRDAASARQVLTEWADLLGVPTDATDAIFDAGSTQSRTYMTQHGEPRVWADTYAVWLDRPVHASLSLTAANGSTVWEADLAEDVVRDDPTSAHGAPAFHAYSASGTAHAHVIYAGHGSHADFARLDALGVRVRGSVVLVRNGGVFRGLAVRAAQEHGAVGVLLYTDPADDGGVTEAHGHAAYPDGPARQRSSLERGSVQALSFQPGDPSTPGAPSYRDAARLPREEAISLPRIPSLPISYMHAQRLLRDMEGVGVEASAARPGWGGAIPHTTYWTGPSRHMAHMTNEMDMQTRDIWNVYAVIPGHIDTQRIMVGHHRDAWGFGAGDPSSGTAAVHEVVRGLGHLLRRGWRPARTIVLASWDAEEYGLVGSTECGEDYASFLQDHVALYHNLDMAVRGSQFRAKASPSLQRVLHDAVKALPNVTLDHVGPLGSGSDFTVFLQHLGIASSDLGFDRAPSDPVYHYHSNYDSFAWMDRFGDPDFARHETVAKVYGLLVLRSAQSLFLPLSLTDTAQALVTHLASLENVARDANVRLAPTWLQRLADAIERLGQGARRLAAEQAALAKRLDAPDGDLAPTLRAVHAINERLQSWEQGWLDARGLRQRTWYRHLGVAPGRWLGYGATTFPGVTESITLDGGQHTTDELARLTLALERLAALMSRGRS